MSSDKFDPLFNVFTAPPTEFGAIPFWFWNDDLDEAVLLRQLHEFHRAGLGGFVPHPRTGLSPRVGYLTEEYFRLLRLVVDEAAKLGMKVILYDEGAYPSGSACGQVVRENPDFATQCINLLERSITGPYEGFWRPNTGRALLHRHVATVLGRVHPDGRIDPETVRLLEPHPHDVFHLRVPAGTWKAMSVWQMPSGGVIRGVLPEHEVLHATAPPAGDILNPDAVAAFIRLTHDRYAQHLRDHLGTTVIAMFTDEPSVMGKDPLIKTGRPFTHGLLDWLTRHLGQDPRPWLPALWLDFGPETGPFRERFNAAIQARLCETFYRPLSEWCDRHGIALTGHPSASNEMSVMRLFQLPGQDMVWRYVLPEHPSALEGPDSVAAKAATSAARLHARRRILTECCGAYGWRHTPDEFKWLIDWHLVRGNNLVSLHAMFYSIRHRRAWESEPDLGLHNVWWPHFHLLARYIRRLSWLLCDGQQVCEVAILGDGDNLPWAAAQSLYQNQIDFLYVDDPAVAGAAVRDGRLVIGSQAYSVVIVDGQPMLSEAARSRLDEFEAGGGRVVHCRNNTGLPPNLPRDLELTRPHRDLRFIHYRKSGLDFYLLINEGPGKINGGLKLREPGSCQWWDPWTGERFPATGQAGVELSLERRQSLVLVVDRTAPPALRPVTRPPTRTIGLNLKWEVFAADGRKLDLPAPGDWARCAGYELFTGTLTYRAALELPAASGRVLELGVVGDIAEVFIDQRGVGVSLWAPYRFALPEALPAGPHTLEVRVTNSMANAYDGAQLPSGLIGPISLRVQ